MNIVFAEFQSSISHMSLYLSFEKDNDERTNEALNELMEEIENGWLYSEWFGYICRKTQGIFGQFYFRRRNCLIKRSIVFNSKNKYCDALHLASKNWRNSTTSNNVFRRKKSSWWKFFGFAKHFFYNLLTFKRS